MCGRYAVAAPRSQPAARCAPAHCDDCRLRCNIAPGQRRRRRPAVAGWRVHAASAALGPAAALLPGGPAIGARLINARDEPLRARPSVRQSFQRRRCLIPTSGFHEWQAATASTRQPWSFSLQSGEPLAMGGLRESWPPPAGDVLRTCCAITSAANDLLRPIHERLPRIVAGSNWQHWPAARAGEADEPRTWPLSQRVGSASAEGSDLIADCRGSDGDDPQ
ncbi:SOS response-associated peptidase family protein [Accumulibacter sp.]|uniref:SOS response-associated peptidase n=1 Tax=Accumulibacter sp. TaxID=2053492 RepID=UPI001597B9B2|nr:SOS response-associated peptidase family protein [Accumulibacter sp.]QKS28792.1 MAG: SOS response-associated peptidase [Candidatus Accumulibacter similis]